MEPTYEAFEAALELARPGVVSMCNIVQLRDFKRREEREAADVRLATRVGMAELIAESVCELPNVWPDFQHSNEKDPA